MLHCFCLYCLNHCLFAVFLWHILYLYCHVTSLVHVACIYVSLCCSLCRICVASSLYLSCIVMNLDCILPVFMYIVSICVAYCSIYANSYRICFVYCQYFYCILSGCVVYHLYFYASCKCSYLHIFCCILQLWLLFAEGCCLHDFCCILSLLCYLIYGVWSLYFYKF